MTDAFVSAERQVLLNLLALELHTGEIEPYGADPDQIIEWHGPLDGEMVVYVHGGYFRATTDRTHARPAAIALAQAGYRVALVEYRRVAGSPLLSLEDMKTLAKHPLLRDAAWVGHSAGGTFVLDVVLDRELEPRRAIALAPLADLILDANENVDGGQTAVWVGGMPEDLPEVYAQVDPLTLFRKLGHAAFTAKGVQADIIHGALDETVPVERSRALRGEAFSVAILPEANHFDLIRPDSDAWLLLLGALHRDK